MQRFDPCRGVAGIVKQSRFPIPGDDRLDQDPGLRRGLGRIPPSAVHQHAPQIFGRARIAPQIAERPAFEELGSDLAATHPCPPSWVHDRLWSFENVMKSRIEIHTGSVEERRRSILIPLVIGCAFFMEGLDSTMIAVAIPDMAKGLGSNPLRLNLV